MTASPISWLRGRPIFTRAWWTRFERLGRFFTRRHGDHFSGHHFHRRGFVIHGLFEEQARFASHPSK